MPIDVAILIWVVGIVSVLIFLVFFMVLLISILRWFRHPGAYYIPIRAEEYMCPRCGSKDLDAVGMRTLKCRKCGTTFTLRTTVFEGCWIIPFFWWFPITLFTKNVAPNNISLVRGEQGPWH